MSKLTELLTGLKDIIGQIEMEVGGGEEVAEEGSVEGEEMPPEGAMSEGAPMDDTAARFAKKKGMRPQEEATMEDYFSSKR